MITDDTRCHQNPRAEWRN